MRFNGLSENDVHIDATPAQRLELVEFLQQSITTKQIETRNHAGREEVYEDIARKIIGQQNGARPLALTREEFVCVAHLADAWQTYAFDIGGDAVTYDVSTHIVHTLRKITDDFMRACDVASAVSG